MATAERAFGSEVVARAFTRGREGDVELANVFTASNAVIAEKGFATVERAGNVVVAAENGFTTSKNKERAVAEVEVARNDVTTTSKDDKNTAVGDVEKVATNNGFVTNERTGDDAEVLHDFSPLLVVYKSGRLERPLILPRVPPGHDPSTGVVSKDVPLSPSSFARLYLPPWATAATTGGETNNNTAPTPSKKKKLPVVVYFHGGGFVVGSAATCAYHRFLNDLAATCPAVAVSVDYRLAPEHPLPAAYEDALAALKWVLRSSSASDSDPWLADHADLRRVFLAGDSAGGNICHHLAMHPDVRRSAGGGVEGVVLVHPWFWGSQPIAGELEHRRRSSSSSRGKRMSLWEFVCPDAACGVDDPRMNPIAAVPGLEALACERVMVCVAEGDHLRWRGKAYADAAARAKKGKAVVETVESEGVGHVFFLLDPDLEQAREMLARIARFVNGDDAKQRPGASERDAATATATMSLMIE